MYIFSLRMCRAAVASCCYFHCKSANLGRKLDDISKFFHRDASLRPNVTTPCKGSAKITQYMPHRLINRVIGCGKANKLFQAGG